MGQTILFLHRWRFDKNSYAYSAIKQLSERPQSMIWDISREKEIYC